MLASARILQLSHIIQVLYSRGGIAHLSRGSLWGKSQVVAIQKEAAVGDTSVNICTLDVGRPWHYLGSEALQDNSLHTQSEVISRHIIKLTPRSGKSPVSLKARDIFRICLYLMKDAQKASGTRLVLYRHEREGGMVCDGPLYRPFTRSHRKEQGREEKFVCVSIPIGLEAHSHVMPAKHVREAQAL